MKNAYTLDTSDIIIPLTELLGECYIASDPHPLAQFEKIGNIAVSNYLGNVREIPILEVLGNTTIYQGREQHNEISAYFVQLWARVFYFITHLCTEDLTHCTLNIISISGGDIRITFDNFYNEKPDDFPNI